MSSFSSCLMQMTYVFSHSILFKRWVGGFRVFYDAMFEICPPSHTLFSYVFPWNVMGSFLPECRFLFHPYSMGPNEDGRKAPTLLRKKNGPLCVSCRLCWCVVFWVLCVLRFFACEFFEYGVFVTNAFRTSVLWHVCELPTMGSVLFVFTPFMALLLLWWFLCERK